MADNDLTLRIGADAAGTTTGAAQAKEAVTGIGATVAELSAGFKSMGAAAIAGFESVAAGAKEAAEQVKGVAESVTAFREMISGLGEAMLAAFAVNAVVDFAKSMGETAEQTQHTATTFGLTTAEVQRLKAEAVGLGLPFEAFTTAMQRSDAALTRAREGSKQTAEAFKAIGINIQTPVDQMTLLNQEIAGLANVADVPTRIGLAMQLFGRNVQNIAPLIGVTKDQLAALNATISLSGAVSNDAQEKGLALAEAFNRQHVEMLGFSNVMASSFAPVLTEAVNAITNMVRAFNQSYQAGGLAKGVMSDLAGIVRLAGTLFDLLARTVVATIDPVVALTDAAMGLGDALAGRLGAATRDEANALHTLADTGHQALQFMRDLKSIWSDGASAGKDLADTTAKIGDGLLNLDTHTGGGESQVGKWVEQLHDAELQAAVNSGNYMKDETATELAFWQQKLALTTANSKTWYDVQSKIFDLMKATQTDAYNALIAGDKDKIAADVANQTQELADWNKYLGDVANAYGKDSAAYLGAQREMTAGLKEELQKREEAAIKAAQDELTSTQKSINDQLSAQKAASQELVTAIKGAAEDGQISQKTATAEIIAQYRQQEDAAVSAAYEAYVAAYQAETQILSEMQAGTPEYAAELAKRTALYKDFASQIAAIESNFDKQIVSEEATATEKIKQQWQSVISPIVSNFSSGIEKMIEGTETFRQFFVSLGMEMLNSWIGSIDKQVSAWIAGQLAQRSAAQASNMAIMASNQAAATVNVATTGAADSKNIMSDAASAAAAAFHAMAGIPVVGPALGAAAAAAVFAGALAFRGMVASAEGGWDNVPYDGVLTQLHKSEMVLPASLATSVRAMAQGQGFDGSGAFSGGGHTINVGDTHIHGGPAGWTSDDFKTALKEHAYHVADAVASGLRGGYYPPYKQPTGRL